MTPTRYLLCGIALAATVLASACATAPVEAPPPGRLVVRNADADPCRINVDRDYLLQVDGRRAVVIANLPNVPFALTARCGDKEFEATIDPQGESLLEFAIPGDGPVVDRTASLEVENPTVEDLEVRLGEELLGRVFGRSRSRFENVPAGEQPLTFASARTRGSWTRTHTLPPLELTRLEIEAPLAQLDFFNDSRETVRVSLLDRRIDLEGGKGRTIEALPPGNLEMQVRFQATGREITLPVTLMPEGRETVRLSDSTGDLLVENRLDGAVELFLGSEQVATLAPGESRAVRGLAPGPALFEARTAAGRVLRQDFVIAPDTAQTWILELATAELMVRNRTGEAFMLHMDGRQVMAVPHRGAVRFPTSAGMHQVNAVCELTGHTEGQTIDVPGGRLVEVAFGPLGGRLYLENRTERTLRFFRNGNPLQQLDPGKWAELGGQPLGTSLIEVLDEAGGTVLSRQVAIAARGEARAEVVVSTTETPVQVRNETGEAVRVGPEARTEKRVIPSGETAEVFLAGTAGVLKFKGESTGNRYDRKVEAPAEGTLELVLDPVTGGIVVENTTRRPLVVRLDGELWGPIAPGATLRRDRVAPGLHQLGAVTDAEEPFDEVSCRLVADSWYVWVLQEKSGRLRILNRAGEDLRLSRDGEPAGVLPDGAEVRLGEITPGPLSIEAVGLRSGQFHRFTARVAADKVTQWTVRPAAGAVRLHGFEGSGAEIFVDGTSVTYVPAGVAEPVTLPLQPGPRVVKTRFDDGHVYTAIVQAIANLESTLFVRGGSPRVKVRNRSGQTIVVHVDGIRAAAVASGADHEVVVEHAGLHSLVARPDDGEGVWVLRDIQLDRGRAFGWTVGEEAGDPPAR